jgi:hypothetical protein
VPSDITRTNSSRATVPDNRCIALDRHRGSRLNRPKSLARMVAVMARLWDHCTGRSLQVIHSKQGFFRHPKYGMLA